MKKELKEFEKFVRFTRRIMPYYNNGRKVVVLSEYSEKGRQILVQGRRNEGCNIYDVYTVPSHNKVLAFKNVWDMFCNDPNSQAFSICSHNCQMFTCSWLNKDGMVFLTKKTEYLVLINE